MWKRNWTTAIILGLVLTALFWIDPLFIPLALLGPLVIGAVAALRGLPLIWPSVVMLVAGLGAVLSDWAINNEDVAFHFVLTVVMLVLTVVAWRVVARRGRTA